MPWSSSRVSVSIPRDGEYCRLAHAGQVLQATFTKHLAPQLTASYHSARARQGSAFSAMRVAAFGQ